MAVVAALPALTAQTATAAAAGVAAKGVPVAKAGFLSGLSGAVLGPIVGLLGGIFGMWMEFYRERSYGFDMPLWGINLVLLAVFGVLIGLTIFSTRKEKC